MMRTIEAVYESGTLKPKEALELSEHEEVRILILPQVELPQSEAEPSRRQPPGLGAFDSGYTDTAERAEEILSESKFGESSR